MGVDDSTSLEALADELFLDMARQAPDSALVVLCFHPGVLFEKRGWILTDKGEASVVRAARTVLAERRQQ